MMLRTQRVSIALEDHDDVSATRLASWYQWAARVERLLPKDHTLRADIAKPLKLCRNGTCRAITSETFTGSSASEAFHMLAGSLALSEDRVKALRSTHTAAYTVQLDGAHTHKAAQALAHKLQGVGAHMHASRGRRAHATPISTERGDTDVYVVFVGVYASERDAATSLKRLRRAGRAGTVRKLAP